MKKYFPALDHRDFKLYMGGQAISLLGTWIQNIGIMWFVLQVTDSPLKLGIVNALQFLPTFVLSLFIGAIADRYSKNKLILYSLITYFGLAILIGEMIRHDMMEYSYLVVIALLLGIANAFYNNARQSYVVELTGKSTLTNAIALSSTVYNLSKFVVPVIAGILIFKYGYTTCFYINSITYIPLIFILMIIQKEERKKVNKGITFSIILDDIAQGFKYVKGEFRLILLLGMLFFSSISLLNYTMQVPIYAKYVLNQEAQGFGALMTFMGIGAFIGAFGIAVKVKKKPNVYGLFLSIFALSTMTILLGLTKSYMFTAIVLVLVGICTVTLTVSINSFIQLITEKSMLGKITSMYTVLYIGSTPIGNILAGTIDEKFGIEESFITLGALGLILSLVMLSVFYRRKYFKQNFNEGGFL